jgi:hypothetical protein
MESIQNDNAVYARRRISLILTTGSVIAWASSLHLSRLGIGGYGYIGSYHYSYHIALILLLVASSIMWASGDTDGKLPCFQLCSLIIVLWATPLILGGTDVSTQWNYAILHDSTASINETTHIQTSLLMVQNGRVALNFRTAFSKQASVEYLDSFAHF